MSRTVFLLELLVAPPCKKDKIARAGEENKKECRQQKMIVVLVVGTCCCCCGGEIDHDGDGGMACEILDEDFLGNFCFSGTNNSTLGSTTTNLRKQANQHSGC